MAESKDRITLRESSIRQYQKAGFALFPVRMINGTKMPACGKGVSWTDTRYNPDLEPKMLGSMYGVVLQSDDLVIDADPRRFVGGVNSLEKFWDDLNLPKPIQTYIVATMQGGTHIYFKKPSGIDVIRNLDKTYPGLEIKSKGQFVVGCGSIALGKQYTHVRGDLNNILDAPESLLEFAKRPDRSLQTGESTHEDSATIKRFVHYLQTCEPAIQGKMGDQTTFNTACVGRDFGLSEQLVADLMLEHFNERCEPRWETEQLCKKVEYAFRYAKNSQGSRSTIEQDFVDYFEAAEKQVEKQELKIETKWQTKGDSRRKGDEKLEPTLANAFYFFMENLPHNKLYKLLRFNLFTQRIEFTRRAPWHTVNQKYWEDGDDVMLKLHLSHEKHFDVPTQICAEVAVAVSRQYQYHPIIEYLESLSWDGVPRLHKLFTDYANAVDSPYHRAVAVIMMVAAVKRIFEPGCKFDYLVILEGDQGVRKSTMIEVLGGPWYRAIPLDMHKVHDTIARMADGWFIETPEMAFLRKATSDELKFFLSNGTDITRFAYGRHTKAYPRSSVFVGTYNRLANEGYLKDPTGGRRFLPIETRGEIDTERLLEDRDQLFAEAVVMYRNGVDTYLKDPDVLINAKQIQNERTQGEPWAYVISDFIENPQNEKLLPQYLTLTFIIESILCVPRGQLKPNDQHRVENAMKELGYKTAPKWLDGRTQRVYVKDYAKGI